MHKLYIYFNEREEKMESEAKRVRTGNILKKLTMKTLPFKSFFISLPNTQPTEGRLKNSKKLRLCIKFKAIMNTTSKTSAKKVYTKFFAHCH